MKLNREARELLLEILQRLYAMLYPDEMSRTAVPAAGISGIEEGQGSVVDRGKAREQAL